MVCRMGGKGLIRRENVLGGAESAAMCLGRRGVRGAVCWFVVAERHSASQDGGNSSSCR